MKREKSMSKSAASGVVALIFLVLGFQAAIFVMKIKNRPAEEDIQESISAEISEDVGIDQARYGYEGSNQSQYEYEGADRTQYEYEGADRAQYEYEGADRAQYEYEGAEQAQTDGSEASAYGNNPSHKEAAYRKSAKQNYPYGNSRQSRSKSAKGSSTKSAKGSSTKSAKWPSTKSAKGSSTKNGRTRLGGYPAPEPKYQQFKPRQIESFPFDPNIVTQEELVRLGLSPRQAEVVINYRQKGGKFKKKSDFAKMYVVSDTLFERLKPYIDIPKIELNSADSTALVSLTGIGPYYAKKIIEYRSRLGGFVSTEQLLEINGIDLDKYDQFKECIYADTNKIRHLDLWNMSADSLASHPYINSFAAKGIIRYKKVCDTSLWTLDALLKNNLITPEIGQKLSRYINN